MGLALRNLSSRVVTIVVHVSAANKVPPKMAPRIIMKTFPVNTLSSVHSGVNVEIEKEPPHLDAPQVCTHATQERSDKLLGKLDLTGTQGWSDKEKQEVKDLLVECHDLFALDDP